MQRLTLHREPKAKFIATFLKPPLYSTAFAEGFGTLYTAVYEPRARTMSLCRPGTTCSLRLDGFIEDIRQVRYPLVA